MGVCTRGGEGRGGVGVRVEGAVTAGATCDRGLTGKHRVQTPASNLLVINQMEKMPHKTVARFTARGHLSRKNSTPTQHTGVDTA